MIRGTTHWLTLTLNTGVDFDDIEVIYLTLKSLKNGKTLEYTANDMMFDFEERTITVPMSQEDTLYLDEGKCRMQLRFRTAQGFAYASNIQEIIVEPVIKKGVI